MPTATLISNLTSPSANAASLFGCALAVAGSTELYVGASGGSAVYIYTTSTLGSTWTLSSNLTGVASTGFGSALALSADGATLFVGAPAAGVSAGAVAVFARTSSSPPTWSPAATLTLPASYGAALLGTSLVFSGARGLLFAGAPGANLVAAFSGGASWSFTSNASLFDSCGFSVMDASALAADPAAGSLLFVGNKDWTGRGMFFAAQPDEGGWAVGTQLQGGTNVGCALAMAPGGKVLLHSACGSVAVGAYAPSGAGPLSGFSFLGTLPRAAGPFYGAPAAGDAYGAAIAIAPTGAFTAVGATAAVFKGRTGAVFVYRYSALTPTPSTTPSASATPSPAPSAKTAACGTNATFTFTGAFQYFSVPAGVTWLSVFLWGAGGSGQGGDAGGGGAFISGNLSVAPGDLLRVIVGAGGGAVANSIALTQVGGAAGFGYPNGGGRSAIQKVLGPSALPQLPGINAASAAVEVGLRGISGGFFSDVATAGGGGGGGGDTQARVVVATPWGSPAQSTTACMETRPRMRAACARGPTKPCGAAPRPPTPPHRREVGAGAGAAACQRAGTMLARARAERRGRRGWQMPWA